MPASSCNFFYNLCTKRTLHNSTLRLLLEARTTARYFSGVGLVVCGWKTISMLLYMEFLSSLLQNSQWTPYFAFPSLPFHSQTLPSHSISRMESRLETEIGRRLAILPAGGRIVVLRMDCRHVGMGSLVCFHDYLGHHPDRTLPLAQGRQGPHMLRLSTPSSSPHLLL